MIADFERYHGVVLRDLIVRASAPLVIEPYVEGRRINTYLLNRGVALHVKHSAKRLPPWQFTFSDDRLEQILGLIADQPVFWLALVCGSDGVVALSASEFTDVTGAAAGIKRFVRIDRDRNTMYRVFGNSGRLTTAKARGTSVVLTTLPAWKRLT